MLIYAGGERWKGEGMMRNAQAARNVWRTAINMAAWAAMAACPGAAVAQMDRDTMETGTLMPNSPAGGYNSRAKDVRIVMAQYAGCTYRRSPARVTKLLTLPIGSSEYKRLIGLLLVDDCLGAGSLQFNVVLIRGALFEQLYVHDFGHAGPVDLSSVAAIDYQSGYSHPLPAEAANTIALAQFGDCATRADAEDARQMILSVPDTALETQAVSGLAHHLKQCVPAGRQVSFSRSVLRTAIAEGLYRLSLGRQGRSWG